MIAVYFLKPLAERVLFGSIEFRFNRKIEKIRNDFYVKQTEIHNEMRKSETQLEELKRSALSALNERQTLHARRVLEAVDQIWSAVHTLGKFSMLTETLKFLKVDELSEADLQKPNYKQVFEIYCKPFNIDDLKNDEAWRAEPYVSDTVWAYYSIYSSIHMFAFATFKILETGMQPKNLLKSDHISEMAKAAFPEYKDGFDKLGHIFSFYIVDDIRKRLLQEIKKLLIAKDIDEASVEQAGRIQDFARAFQDKQQQVATEPGMLSL